MNTKPARNLFGLGILASALVACGGGGDEAVACPSVNPAFCAGRSTGAPTPTPTTPATPGTSTPTPSAQAIVLAPSALVIGNCTTRVPFIFSGGTGPFSIFTSDNFNVPVSSALPLDGTRSYFFADVHYPPLAGAILPSPSAVEEAIATVTVIDAQARTAVATITTPVRADPCPANPLLSVFPETANFRTSEILAFQISGGPAVASAPTVTFADAGVAAVVSINPTVVTVQAIATARATTLMTVATSDGQRASIVINVLPQ